MKFLLFIIAAIGLFWLRSIIFKKIDEDEAKALATPGRANFIRDNYNEIVEFILKRPHSKILFERKDQIRIGINDESEYIAINSYSGGLLIVYVKWSAVQKEWKFTRNESSSHIIYELHKYLD